MGAEETPSVEERIVQAAIDCIEQYGLQGATNRRIAARAGVNGAAINYYFRSKEALIERCMRTTLDNAFDWESFAAMPGATAKERCAAIFKDLLLGACNFPGLTRAHFFEMVAEGNYKTVAVEKINDFVDHLVRQIQEIGTTLDEEALRLAVAQMSAAVMMLSLAPRMFQKSTGLDLCDEESRQRFVRRLVDSLL